MNYAKDVPVPPREITRETELANRVNQEMIEGSYSISEMTALVTIVRQFVIDQLIDCRNRADKTITEATVCAEKLGL